MITLILTLYGLWVARFFGQSNSTCIFGGYTATLLKVGLFNSSLIVKVAAGEAGTLLATMSHLERDNQVSIPTAIISLINEQSATVSPASAQTLVFPNRLIVPPGHLDVDGNRYTITNDGFYFLQGKPDPLVMEVQPFYGSVSVIAFVLSLSVFLSWISVIALHLSPRRRPWLQSVCLLLNAAVLTSTLARGSNCLQDQYNLGYEDPWELVNVLIYGYNYMVPQFIGVAVSWMAHFQVILMLFRRPRQKFVLQWIFAVLWIVEVVFWGIVYFRHHHAFYYVDPENGPYGTQGVSFEPNEFTLRTDNGEDVSSNSQHHMLIVAVVFELFLCTVYLTCVTWHTILQRAHAYTRKNIPIAIVSILVMTAPLGFVPLYLVAPSSGWAGFLVTAVDGVTLVVVWNWLDAIANAERDEQRKGIMGRRIYDGLATQLTIAESRHQPPRSGHCHTHNGHTDDSSYVSNVDLNESGRTSHESSGDENEGLRPHNYALSEFMSMDSTRRSPVTQKSHPVYLDAILNWPANTLKKKTRHLKRKLNVMVLPSANVKSEPERVTRVRYRSGGPKSEMAKYIHPYSSTATYKLEPNQSTCSGASVSRQASTQLLSSPADQRIFENSTPDSTNSNDSFDIEVVEQEDDMSRGVIEGHLLQPTAVGMTSHSLSTFPHTDASAQPNVITPTSAEDENPQMTASTSYLPYTARENTSDEALPDAFPPLEGYGPGDYWDDKASMAGPSSSHHNHG